MCKEEKLMDEFTKLEEDRETLELEISTYPNNLALQGKLDKLNLKIEDLEEKLSEWARKIKV